MSRHVVGYLQLVDLLAPNVVAIYSDSLDTRTHRQAAHVVGLLQLVGLAPSVGVVECSLDKHTHTHRGWVSREASCACGLAASMLTAQTCICASVNMLMCIDTCARTIT